MRRRWWRRPAPVQASPVQAAPAVMSSGRHALRPGEETVPMRVLHERLTRGEPVPVRLVAAHGRPMPVLTVYSLPSPALVAEIHLFGQGWETTRLPLLEVAS